MKKQKHYQVLENIIEKLNNKGRDLSIHDDHDEQEFVVLRIKEGNKSIKFPFTKIKLYEIEEGETVYETPCRSMLAETPYGYTDDCEIKTELVTHYGNNFEVYPLTSLNGLKGLSTIYANRTKEDLKKFKSENLADAESFSEYEKERLKKIK